MKNIINLKNNTLFLTYYENYYVTIEHNLNIYTHIYICTFKINRDFL